MATRPRLATMGDLKRVALSIKGSIDRVRDRVAALEEATTHRHFTIAKGQSEGKGGFWDETGSYFNPDKFASWLIENGYKEEGQGFWLLYVDGQDCACGMMWQNSNDINLFARKGGSPMSVELCVWVSNKGYKFSNDDDCALEVVRLLDTPYSNSIKVK